jgi:hypothetical protein
MPDLHPSPLNDWADDGVATYMRTLRGARE